MSTMEAATQATGDNNDLVNRIEAELAAYADLGLSSDESEDLIPKWQDLVVTEPKRFINDDHSVNFEALKNFRRSQIFVPDNPLREVNRPSFRNLIGGERRGLNRQLRECLTILKEHGCEDLLRKYPCHTAGNPFVFRHQGFSYTYRWTKHIYSLSLFNRVLADKLGDEFIALDIGSSYGIFSNLVKREYPKSHHILVDFPEQLILAYYFLGTCFPEARIAGVREFHEQGELNRDFFQEFDFYLLPWSIYQRIADGSLDLVTNFASLGEMSRKYFDYYLKSAPFQTAKYFFTANRMQSFPDYDTDLTVLDYPIWELGKKLHFDTSPIFSNVYRYPRRNLFFNEKLAYPPYFEYIGEI